MVRDFEVKIHNGGGFSLAIKMFMCQQLLIDDILINSYTLIINKVYFVFFLNQR